MAAKKTSSTTLRSGKGLSETLPGRLPPNVHLITKNINQVIYRFLVHVSIINRPHVDFTSFNVPDRRSEVQLPSSSLKIFCRAFPLTAKHYQSETGVHTEILVSGTSRGSSCSPEHIPGYNSEHLGLGTSVGTSTFRQINLEVLLNLLAFWGVMALYPALAAPNRVRDSEGYVRFGVFSFHQRCGSVFPASDRLDAQNEVHVWVA